MDRPGTDEQTDNMKTVSPPSPTDTVCRGYNNNKKNRMLTATILLGTFRVNPCPAE